MAMESIDIFVMNMSELLYSSYRHSPDKETIQRIIQSDADRVLLYGSHNKIVVTSLPIHQELITDLTRILKYKNAYVSHPAKPTYSLSGDIINGPELSKKILSIVHQLKVQKVNVIPYGTTYEFLQLVEWLKKKLPRVKVSAPESCSQEQLFLRDYVDQKSGFRDYWSRSRAQIKSPEGFVCKNVDQAIKAARYFHSIKKGFLFKHDTGVSGWGIIKFRFEKSFNEILKKVDKNLKENPLLKDITIVVEELIDIDIRQLGGSPSLEYSLSQDEKGMGIVKFEYLCEQVVTDKGNFEGIVLSGNLKNSKWSRLLKKSGDKFATLMLKMGYRGVFDIDFVISKKGEVFAIESNTRRTGGTHVWEASKYLLGKNIGQYFIYSNDVLPVKENIKNYLQLKSLLSDLYWGNFRAKEGILISGSNMLQYGKFGYIVFAKSKSTLDKINKEITKRLSLL